MSNPLKYMTKKEWMLWIASLIIVILSNLFPGHVDALTLIAACTGVTSLIFAAKGNVWAQILIILFSILYGVISFRFHYWGEMITYLGMTMPMAVWSTITWIMHPSDDGRQVQIAQLTRKHVLWLSFFTVIVTAVFWYILKYFDTPNMVFSTLSVTTSFIAASLSMLRTSWFAFFYAMNDLVLIVLWVSASLQNPQYIPVVVNFAIFLVNDLYGFVCWKRRENMRIQ